jgi:hypothetical protein
MISRAFVTPRVRVVLLAGIVAIVVGAQAAAQSSGRARLIVTVLDQTGAILAGAPVTVARQDRPGAAQPARSVTSGAGTAVFDDLEPARYEITTSFSGFQTTVLRDARLRAGENRRTITLPLEKLDEAVTITRDKQSVALDARGSAFSTVLTREQIDALPDDPDEMEAALKAMAPPGATVRVDGFTGGRLPPKSQIRSIRLPRMDMFAAQNHGGMSGALFIDIMTQPGAGPVRGSADFIFLDDALNARNAMTPEKGDEQLRQGSFALSGTIAPNKTAFSVSGGGASQYFSSNLYAIMPDGTIVADALRQPQDRVNLNARIDHALTKDHALRASFDYNQTRSDNLGVGDFNLAERGYTSANSSHMFRLSENGPVWRKGFWESRLQVRSTGTDYTSNVQAATVRVNDAFTSGGAQMRGGRRDTTFELASDLDYVKGNHSWRTGILLEGGHYHSDDTSNYLGTYTFASLTDYNAGRASSYTRRLGNPDLTFNALQSAAYVQDDWRVRRSLLVSAGVRFGFQSHVDDATNLSPRLSAAWSPLRNGSLTLRANYGYFYDWISSDVYKQTLLVDGYRQREFNVQDPSYPDPGLVGTSPPSNRYLWGDAVALPNAHRTSVGVERVLTPNSRVTVSYNFGWGRGLLRPRNTNAPVSGVRPDPEFANVLQLSSDAESRSHAVNVAWNFSRFDWHRTFAFVNYTWSKGDTNTAGAFALLPGGDNLGAEWGPSNGDLRHRLGASVTTEPVKNVTASLNVSARSGLPYNVTTGRDDSGDGVFNERPAGTSRNSARGGPSADLGGKLAYAWGFGKPRQVSGGGGQQVTVSMGGSGGGGIQASFSGGANDKRYRLEFYLAGQNLLNRVNYTAYSGVMTSPLFLQPTAAAQARRLQVGIRFAF